MRGDRLLKLMKVEIKAEVRSDGTATLRSLFPDEVQFESLATRVRAFALPKDRLYWRKGLDAVDRLPGWAIWPFVCCRAICAWSGRR
jgi:hypothetical protein